MSAVIDLVDLVAADQQLHDRLVARDPSGVLECLDRFGASVYCIALAESGDVAVAEDLTERAFIELWRRPEAFDPRRAPMVLQLVRWMLAELAEARHLVGCGGTARAGSVRTTA